VENRLLWANPYFASQNNLFRHGCRRATFPRGEGFAAAPLNYNLDILGNIIAHRRGHCNVYYNFTFGVLTR
jgi:hypothetical protein